MEEKCKSEFEEGPWLDKSQYEQLDLYQSIWPFSVQEWNRAIHEQITEAGGTMNLSQYLRSTCAFEQAFTSHTPAVPVRFTSIRG